MSHRLVRVHWYDAWGVDPAWQDMEESKLMPVQVISVGWLLRHDQQAVVLTSHVTSGNKGGEQESGRMVIPAMCVSCIFDLKCDGGDVDV